MLLEVLMNIPAYIFIKQSPLEQKFRAIQIVIITNFVVVASVGIKKVDCICVKSLMT